MKLLSFYLLHVDSQHFVKKIFFQFSNKNFVLGCFFFLGGGGGNNRKDS